MIPVRRPLVAFALAALALVPALVSVESVRAAEGPQWAPSFRKAVEWSRERGAPILVWCVGDQDADEKADHDTLTNARVVKAMTGYILVLANPVDTHGKIDGTLEGKPAKVCRLAPGITCADHIRCWSEIYGTFADVMGDKNGNIKVPNHFIVDSDGKVIGAINSGTLAGGFGVVSPETMEKELGKMLIRAGGPGLSDDAIEEFRKRLAAARGFLDNGRMSEAAKELKPITAIRKNLAIVREAKELLARVEVQANEALGKAGDLLKKEPVDGLLALDEVAERFPGTESAAKAAERAEEFRKSPAGKKALADLARDKKGQEALAKALEVADAGDRDVEAVRLLESVARTYAGLPSGRAAARRVDEILADPARARVLEAARQEKAASGALFTAKGLAAGGKKDEARAALLKLIEEFPETEAAGEAKKMLEDLR